jgi:N-acetylglutamate synthase-like GNAT family acetyltransferase
MKIVEPNTPRELESYYRIRYEILRKPWNQPEQSTKDEWEDKSIHLLMLGDSGEGIATGRLQLDGSETGHIRSMAVVEHMQNKGLGTQIIHKIEDKAKEKKLKKIILDAREEAVHFYEKNGYKVIGDSYLLFGTIKHYRMEKVLTIDH